MLRDHGRIGTTRRSIDAAGPAAAIVVGSRAVPSVHSVRCNGRRPELDAVDPATVHALDRQRPRGHLHAVAALGDPAEFGRIAAFVLSPAASYLSGAMVPVDGGLTRSL